MAGTPLHGTAITRPRLVPESTAARIPTRADEAASAFSPTASFAAPILATPSGIPQRHEACAQPTSPPKRDEQFVTYVSQ